MITFTKIRWKNVLSYGETFSEMDLDHQPTTLMVGTNGVGKSTVIEVLCLALFGKPFRKINKSGLVNSINKKGCIVEIEFETGSNKYMVRRGIKPNKFEIYKNDNLVPQDASVKDYQDNLEKNIIKTNYKAFTQVVILGSALYTPFMELTTSDRRQIVEELLDIGIFSNMNIVAKSKIKGFKSELSDIKHEISMLKNSVDLESKHLDKLKGNNDNIIKQHVEQVEISKHKIIDYNKRLKDINSKIEDIKNSLSITPDIKKIQDEYSKYIDMKRKINFNKGSTQKELDFFDINDVCPTCNIPINKSYKRQIIKNNSTKLNNFISGLSKLEKELKNKKKKLDVYDKLVDILRNHQTEITTIQQEIDREQNNIQRNQKLITGLQSDNSDDISDIEKKIKNNTKKLEKQRKEYNKLSDEKNHYDLIIMMLKDDGIKTQIIKQYIPIMNQLINKYLNILEFPASFQIDENFDEKIKSRYHDEFVYANFSEGEKQRINLSLLLTWRDIAKMRNSSSTNLLILDEVFDSSLDGAGVDGFIQILKSFGKEYNTFIISHTGDLLYDQFPGYLEFKKDGNFSQIKEG